MKTLDRLKNLENKAYNRHNISYELNTAIKQKTPFTKLSEALQTEYLWYYYSNENMTAEVIKELAKVFETTIDGIVGDLEYKKPPPTDAELNKITEEVERIFKEI